MCEYQVDVREYFDHGQLGNITVYSFDFDEVYENEELRRLINELEVFTPLATIEEQLEDYSRCNDGGEYFSIIRLFEISPCVYLAVHGDSRELFSVEERKYIVVYIDGDPIGMVLGKKFDGVTLLKKEELQAFVDGYLKDGYRIYYAEE